MQIYAVVMLFSAAGFLAIVVSLAVNVKRAGRITTAATILAAVGGFFCYGYGFAHQTDFLPLAVVRSVLACLGMFLGRNDFSAVNGTPFFVQIWGQLVFWASHFLALYVTASAALTTIGAGALRRLRLWLARWGDLTVIFGVEPGSLRFGRRLLADSRTALVFTDDQADAGLAGEIAAMGAAFCQGEAGRHFLRSVDMHPGRRLWVYAMHSDAAKNLRFAAELMGALEDIGADPRRTSLCISGAEDIDAGRFQAQGERYGYGSVMVFSSADLAARLLIRECPPCRTLTFDANARAAGNFEALVVGFGQVGQAVLRHLVMYGQFEGSRFRLAVFAPDCRQVSGFLTGSCRQLLERYDISFHPFDARSEEMYQYLSEHRDTLKYAVVCTGSQKLNDEIAGELTRCLARFRCDAPVYQCSAQGLRFSSRSDGLPRQWEIYSPQILCPGRMDRMAAALNQRYCAGNGLSTWENWARCDYFSRVSSRASADFIPSMLYAAGRTAEQVLAGDWKLTEAQLENLGRTEHLRWCAFHYVMGFQTMEREDFAQRCARYREEKARTGSSALRLNKDMELRRHACLVPWEELDALSRAENAVTGGQVDYKAMDINNVLAVPEVLRAGRDLGDQE